MKTWESMTSEEKVVAVLTERCEWESHYDDDGTLIGMRPNNRAWWIPLKNLPPILTSADAAIEHVGKAIEEKGYSWAYDSVSTWSEHKGSGAVIIYKPPHPETWWAKKSVLAVVGDLATALCEAAWKMKGGEG